MGLRLLWHSSAPWICSGYGAQTALFAPRIKALGHDIAISGYAGMTHGKIKWNDDIMVFPGGINGAIGMDVIGYWWETFQADVCIALTDAWAMSARQMALLPRCVFWMPVDQSPLSKMNREALAVSKAAPLAMTRFGQRVLADAGFSASYCPHGVDTQVFAPPADRQANRAAAGIDPDTFVIGLNAANRDTHRKRFPEQLEAFARFHASHPDSKLILHTAKEHPKGEDLPLILDELGLSESSDVVRFCNQDQYAAGEISSEDLASAFYGVLDLYTGVTTEGFGIPLIEAGACGVPQVVPGGRPHWSSGIPAGAAAREVGGPPAIVAASQQFWVKAHEANWDQPVTGHECSRCGHLDGIEGAYEQAWQEREDGTLAERGAAAREHALQYDADLVTTQFWKPFLSEIEASL